MAEGKKVVIDLDQWNIIKAFLATITIPLSQAKEMSKVVDAVNSVKEIVDNGKLDLTKK